ncbi:hypothetical protein CDAR_255161 [Caerostris darwini]|uniref:Uncharacterized protein n=1 Tax=Caerostris darwini TaxID=1538125 RepID=A0AAV4V130_9ARAC|nr:hypothetical protein CDAR_255161 [Caerostris darwini]
MANDFSCPSRALGGGGRGAPRIESVPGGQMKTRDQHPQLERKVKTRLGQLLFRSVFFFFLCVCVGQGGFTYYVTRKNSTEGGKWKSFVL